MHARDGHWVGFDPESGVHRIYLPSQHRITVECNVTFERPGGIILGPEPLQHEQQQLNGNVQIAPPSNTSHGPMPARTNKHTQMQECTYNNHNPVSVEHEPAVNVHQRANNNPHVPTEETVQPTNSTQNALPFDPLGPHFEQPDLPGPVLQL